MVEGRNEKMARKRSDHSHRDRKLLFHLGVLLLLVGKGAVRDHPLGRRAKKLFRQVPSRILRAALALRAIRCRERSEKLQLEKGEEVHSL